MHGVYAEGAVDLGYEGRWWDMRATSTRYVLWEVLGHAARMAFARSQA